MVLTYNTIYCIINTREIEETDISLFSGFGNFSLKVTKLVFIYTFRSLWVLLTQKPFYYVIKENRYMIEQEPEFTCCLCGQHFKGFGNNAWPLGKGKCCDKCNQEKVIPERFIRLMKAENKNDRNS